MNWFNCLLSYVFPREDFRRYLSMLRHCSRAVRGCCGDGMEVHFEVLDGLL